jgi:hypothetical protein
MLPAALDGLLGLFGPFVIPVVLFVGGVIGYLLLVVLSRARNG